MNHYYVPGTLLRILQILINLLTILGSRCCDLPFTDEKTKTKNGLNNLPKVTHQVGERARAETGNLISESPASVTICHCITQRPSDIYYLWSHLLGRRTYTWTLITPILKNGTFLIASKIGPFMQIIHVT